MKRSKHLEPLSHDHYQGLLVAGRLRQGLSRQAPPDVMAAYVTHVWQTHLVHHFRQEERLLLPLLGAPTSSDLAKRLLTEHRLIRNLVLQTREDASGTAQKLAALSRLLKAHIRFEERVLFPALETHIPAETLSEVGAQFQETHTEADLNWTPAFWE